MAIQLGMALGECLTYRVRLNPWIPAFLDKLRKVLFVGQSELKMLNGVQFLGGAFADTLAFKNAAAEIVKEGGSETGRKLLVYTFELETEE